MWPFPTPSNVSGKYIPPAWISGAPPYTAVARPVNRCPATDGKTLWTTLQPVDQSAFPTSDHVQIVGHDIATGRHVNVTMQSSNGTHTAPPDGMNGSVSIGSYFFTKGRMLLMASMDAGRQIMVGFRVSQAP